MEYRENKSSIKLRQKPTKDGGQSLYLDIYHKGVRKYEFLHLYLLPETSRKNQAENRNTLQLAEAVRSKRVVEYQNGLYGFNSYERANTDFYPYLQKTAKAAQKHGCSTTDTAHSLEKKLRSYCSKSTLPFSMIDKEFIIGFIEFLHTPKAVSMTGRISLLSPNSIVRIYTLLNTTLNRAVRDELIPFNPTSKIPKEYLPTKEKVERCYLTEDELRKLYHTPTWMNNHSREKFLFGCATGLRHSDIVTLEWKHITIGEDGTYTLKKKQVKTGVVVEFPLSRAAIDLLPKMPPSRKGLVFNGAVNNVTDCRSIKKWAKRAGITKNISFHTSRHTFATIALARGVDIYTVSKMLGHTNVTQTQVYAKLLDTAKKKAVELMPTFD